ncbi:hypothetical protein [Pseudomonas purpurea]|uniref:hypothetical protein n=1 Tax=Pseudomonas purpurea TaxID=3136737 RepID=UPI0032674AE7
MSAPVGSLSSGPACEAGKLIVQVIGKDHPAGQKIVLCDEANKELKGKPEPLEKDLCSSVLHVWDCAGQATRNLWLEITSSTGKPIRLPLLKNVRASPRQADAQWNQLVPVLPFVALPGSKSSYDLGAPVLARTGFIYAFYQKKLWRELEVRIEEGKTTYHDIDVAQYRQGNGFKTGNRQATGQPLEDIWLPAIWNNQRVMDLQLCFSEIQLNAPRLRHLEQDAKARDQRCRNPDLSCSNARFKDLYKGKPDGQAMLQAFSNFDVRDRANQTSVAQVTVVRRNLDLSVFPLTVVAPQRPRSPAYEYMLDHPAQHLFSLDGQFPVKAGQEAKDFLIECAKGTSPKATATLEVTAVADTLENSLPVPKPTEEKKDDPPAKKPDLWLAHPSTTDVLTKARERQVCGVLLDDSRYRLRYLQNRIKTHPHLLLLCARHAARQVNHASALLVQQLVVPRNISGAANPLHASMEKLSASGKQDINRCTATVERAMVWQHMNTAQDLLTESLQQASTQQTLADHFSLDDFEYACALFCISQTIAAIAIPPARLDPLAPSGDVVDAVSGVSLYSPTASEGQKFIGKIASDKKSPLHVMLWPECDEQTTDAPYQVPTKEDENTGDGRFRATELAKNEKKPAPAIAQQKTEDSLDVANLLAGASLNSYLTTKGKAVTGALVSIFENLQGAVNLAVKAIEAPQAAADLAADEAKARKKTSTESNDRLESLRKRLASKAKPVTVQLHSIGVQQLRSMLPDAFGAAYFMSRGKVTQKYYVFGLEDLPAPETTPKTLYGEYLDKNGKLLGSTDRKRMPADGVETATHKVLVLPRDHVTAKLTSNMNKEQATNKQAKSAANSADDAAKAADNALNTVIKRHKTLATAQKVLGSSPVCIAVLMLEIWNVGNETQAWTQSLREKNMFRVVGGVAGAGLDLIIAMEALTVKVMGSQSALAAAREPIYIIPKGRFSTGFGEALGKRLVEKVTARLIGQLVSGTVFAFLNIYDAIYAWQWNDKAMYGYLLMAGGALAGVTSGVFSGVAMSFLGMQPLGWLSLLLIGIGAGPGVLAQ